MKPVLPLPRPSLSRPHLSRPALAVGAALAVTAVTALTALSAPAAAAPAGSAAPAACRSVQLPTLGTGASQLSGGDPTGRYLLGQVVTPDPATGLSTITPVVWTDRRIHPLNTAPLRPAVQVDLVDVNRHGVVAGQRMTDYHSFHTDAFTYRAGRYTWLPPLHPGDVTTVTGIDDRGDVVGYDQDQQQPSVQYHAVVWPAGNPSAVRELTLPGQPTASLFALGIDEDGTVLGTLGGQPGAIPYVWPTRGAAYPLTAPAGTTDPVATAIRDGWVVGTANQADGQPVGVRWNPRTRQPEVRSTAYPSFRAVNAGGEVAAIGAVIHRDGRAVPADGAYPVLLTDNGTVAGNPSLYTGPATLWLGC